MRALRRWLIGDEQLRHHAARRRRARRCRSSPSCREAGARMQLAASTRSPSISTMQTRQLPSGR